MIAWQQTPARTHVPSLERHVDNGDTTSHISRPSDKLSTYSIFPTVSLIRVGMNLRKLTVYKSPLVNLIGAQIPNILHSLVKFAPDK